MTITRLPASAPFRSRAVAFDRLVWAVANGSRDEEGFDAQAAGALHRLENTLRAAGSDKEHLLSVQIFLADIDTKPQFDALWNEWIGSDPERWPQRICLQAVLSPGLLVEMQAVAARE